MRYLAILGGVVVILGGAQARADGQTPNDFSFGIGVGAVLPADITEPNLAVASFRYKKNIEIQPFIVFSSTESDAKADDGVVTSTDKASAKTRGAGAVFKYAFSHRNNMDLQFIGSLHYSRDSSIEDPEGPNNRVTTEEKAFDVAYGLGLQWWFASHFSLMATATNPIFSSISSTTRAQQVGGTLITKSNDRSYGIVWDPQISFAVMTWF